MSPPPSEARKKAPPGTWDARAPRAPRPPPRPSATSRACTRGIPIRPYHRDVTLIAPALALVLLAAAARPAWAGAPDVDAPVRDDEAGAKMKPEARERYDRGLALYQGKDYAGAIKA